MLPSSRALARTARWPIIAGAAHRRAQTFQRLSFSIGATKAHPPFVLEAPEDRIQPTGKNVTRNYVTSSQALQRLVEEEQFRQASVLFSELRTRGSQLDPHPVYAKAIGNMLSQGVLCEEHYEDLVHWFTLLPDARNTNPLLLHTNLGDLRRHVQANATFLRNIAQLLAVKGYKGLLEDDILPLAMNTLGNDQYISLKDEVAGALANHAVWSVSAPSSATVFEEASDDYASVMEASGPPPLSTLEHIEATLPQTLPASDITDQFVFEDEMAEDYLILQKTTHQATRQTPADRLLQLVKHAKYNDALHLLKELRHLHVEVPASHAFGTVALYALRRPLSDDYTLEDKLELFTTWFSLVPLIHEHPGANTLQDIQREVMHSFITNIPLIKLFYSILVEKGYTGLAEKQALSVAMRFSSPDEVAPYIESLEKANTLYWEKYRPQRAASETMQFSGKLRGNAIRYLVYSGKLEEAIALLPERNSGVKLPLYTCEKLLRTISDTNNPSFKRYLPRIRTLLVDAVSSDSQEKLRQLYLDAENKAMENQLHTSGVHVHVSGTLSETLRSLKKSMRVAGGQPHPSVIFEFLERYSAIGRTRAPTLLLNLATRIDYHSTCVFLFAEMMYYRRTGRHHLVIQTFIDHFYLSGVPREEVMKMHHEFQRLRSQNPSNLNNTSSSSSFTVSTIGEEEHHSSFNRLCKFSPSILPRGKTWPMRVHCNLVWHALVSLTPTHSELENLYSKLRGLARGQDPFHTVKSLAPLRPLLPPPSWRKPVDHVAFTPFMRRLMLNSGPNRGARVINDMLDLNIEPSIYHYTELAGFYARLGDIQAAMSIVNNLEESSKLVERLKRQKLDSRLRVGRGLVTVSTSTSSSPPVSDPELPSSDGTKGAHTVPEPDLVFYVSIMRGFLISKSAEGFQAVHARLNELRKFLPNKQFTAEQVKMLDELYRDYRALGKRLGYNYMKEGRAKFIRFMEHHRKEKQR